MTKNPLLNALAAAAYVAIVASIMFYGPKVAGHHSEDTVIAPIAILSLFSLSAAVMGYVFLAQPLQLYLDGKKGPAVKLFSRTLAIFAGITAVLVALLISGWFS